MGRSSTHPSGQSSCGKCQPEAAPEEPIIPNKPRVVLADDVASVIESLRRLLGPEFEVVAAVGEGRALAAAVEKLNPDVAVVDITMPLLNGIEAARLIQKTNPGVRIVFLTVHEDVAYAREALRAGGSGYVLKSSAGAELLTGIREALSGRVYVSPPIAERLRRAART